MKVERIAECYPSCILQYLWPALNKTKSCADPGIFVRAGGSRSVWQKKLWERFFFVFVFFSPQLILQKSNGQFQRNLSFFKVPEGVQHFPGGVQLFPGGSNCLFPIETHITCDFQRGSNIFEGGSNFFQGGGVQLLISYRNPYNLWFSGGGGPDPLSPPSGSALENFGLLFEWPLKTGFTVRVLFF